MDNQNSTAKLLIVDDDDMIRLFLKRTLNDPNYQVDEAADGLDALHKITEKQYDVAIVDLNMPGMNGEQLIRQVRSRDKYIGLIVLTGETDIDVSFRLLEQYDISDYLMKPMFKELKLQLRFSVRNALARRNFLLQQARYIVNLEFLKHQAEEAKSQFLTQMNHELNTPMNVILGFSQLLDSMEAQLEPTQKKYVKQIVGAGWTLMDMIEKILKLSSVEFDTQNLESTPVALSSLCDDIIRQSEIDAQKRNIQLHNKVQQGLAVQADALQLRSAIHSLVSNGIIYNLEGGTVIIHSAAMDNDTIRLTVEDNGKGIELAKQHELFKPFNRLGAELKTVSGAGVSLALAQRMIEAMGGRIGCDSEPGKGSRFWIELPKAS